MENEIKYLHPITDDHPVLEIIAVYIDGILQTFNYTGYTGQPGDEYPGHRNQAVIVFDSTPKKNNGK